MTNDLISREALLIEMAAGCMPLNEKGISGVTGDESTIADYIKNAPAVDAAPVVHSEWVKEENRTNHWHCKNCGLVEGMAHYMMHYCPNCGARMDKEADNAQE